MDTGALQQLISGMVLIGCLLSMFVLSLKVSNECDRAYRFLFRVLDTLITLAKVTKEPEVREMIVELLNKVDAELATKKESPKKVVNRLLKNLRGGDGKHNATS